jgi:hypothetical protein
MERIKNWLAWPFQQELLRASARWDWDSDEPFEEREASRRELHRRVAQRHPIWYARFRLALWLRSDPLRACREFLKTFAAAVLLVGVVLCIALEFITKRTAWALRLKRRPEF